MKPLFFLATALMSGCLRNAIPNHAPRIEAVNGVAQDRWDSGSPRGSFLEFELGQTLELRFDIVDPEGHAFDVYFPEAHPGWSWDAASLTATWRVPQQLVDPDTSAQMLLVDRHPNDPRSATVWLGLWSEQWPTALHE